MPISGELSGEGGKVCYPSSIREARTAGNRVERKRNVNPLDAHNRAMCIAHGGILLRNTGAQYCQII